MGGEFYKIPPALRATSLFKGGFRANNVRPYGEVVYLFEKGGAMWASPPTNPPVTYGDIPLFKGDERLLRLDGHLL